MKKLLYMIFLALIAVTLYVIMSVHSFVNTNSISTEAAYIDTTQNIDQDQLNQIITDYGEDNIVKFYELYDTTIYDDLRATTSNFADISTYTFDPYIGHYIPQKITLLDGQVWEPGSQEAVMVIDEAMALDQYHSIDNAIGQKVMINQLEFSIIGVVSNTTYREREYEYYNEELGQAISIDMFSKNIYIPYYYANYDFDALQPGEPVMPTAIMIHADGYRSLYKIATNVRTITDAQIIDANALFINDFSVVRSTLELLFITGLIYWSFLIVGRLVGTRKNNKKR